MPSKELVILRVSLARIAQAFGLEEHIPGADGRVGMSFIELNKCAGAWLEPSMRLYHR